MSQGLWVRGENQEQEDSPRCLFCLSASVCDCLCLALHVNLCMSLCFCLGLSVCLWVCISVSVSLCVSNSLSLLLSFSLCLCVFAGLSACLSACLSSQPLLHPSPLQAFSAPPTCTHHVLSAFFCLGQVSPPGPRQL